MIRKISFLLLWLAFASYAFLLAPGHQSDALGLIQKLTTGQWEDINPFIIALFNLMGIWPMVYGGVLFADGRGQKVPAWPFAAASFGVGAFAILPYLAFRKPALAFVGEPDRLLKFWDSRWLGIVLGGSAIALLWYGLTQGDWSAFIQQWQTNRFIHVMSLDFCLLSLLFSTLIKDDLIRRGMNPQWWLLSLIPLLGPITYLIVRQPLASSDRFVSNAAS
ncbi:MAG: DUF2834 domain-containing protein [Thermosynechococcaceae cyanobacterium]